MKEDNKKFAKVMLAGVAFEMLKEERNYFAEQEAHKHRPISLADIDERAEKLANALMGGKKK